MKTRSSAPRNRPFRPTLEVLEERTTPTSGGEWALLADPEGYVYHDINGNSSFDPTETAVGAGWSVFVDTNNNTALDPGEINTTTDASGHYAIFLPDGTYSIRVVPQSGFQNDTRPLGTLVRDFPSIESGSFPPGSNNYSGLAWVNGSLYVTFTRDTFNPSDNVMYQVDPQTMTALGPAVSLPGEVAEITFDGTDFWGADFAADSVVRFNFAGQELQRLSLPGPGMDVRSVEWDGAALRVLDASGHRIYQVDPSGTGTVLGFINAPNETTGGLTFDGTSLWLSGRDSDRVYALDPTTGAVQRSFAAPAGDAFGLAVRGQYLWLSDRTVSRVFQYDLGYGGGRIVTVAGADVHGVDLAVFQLGSISGRVFNDNNQNGTEDAIDGGLATWRVYVEANANGKYDAWEQSTVTDALGNYTLSSLRPAQYTVALDVAGQRLTRWSQVAPAGGTYSVPLTSGEEVTGKDFANFLDRSAPQPNEWGTFEGGRMNLYTGVVWADVLRITDSSMTYNYATNYIANSTEGGFDDWRMPNKAEAQAVAATGYGSQFGYDPNAFYLWWTSTSAGGHKQWAVNLNTGLAYTSSWDSALLTTMLRDPATYIDDGATGYSATGFTRKNTSGAYQGDQSTAAAGTGSKTATWTFGGLEVGATYKVDITWKAAGSAATNAPFKVIDGTTTVTTVAINQQAAPGDFAIADIGWKGLGTFTMNSSTLKIQLSNAANGTVLADAVRIFKVLPSYRPPALLGARLPTGAPSAQIVSDAAVTPLIREAVARWQAAGADPAALAAVNVRVADLGGSYLGLASGDTIWLDDNAAGWGWFIDPTPGNDSEFLLPGNQGEQGRMDLLSVLMHEMGHLLGHDHGDGVMHETLAAGTRDGLAPMPVPVPVAADTLFASRGHFDAAWLTQLLERKDRRA